MCRNEGIKPFCGQRYAEVFANGLQKSVCNFAPEEKKQNYR